jgi:hypothetical protein
MWDIATILLYLGRELSNASKNLVLNSSVQANRALMPWYLIPLPYKRIDAFEKWVLIESSER